MYLKGGVAIYGGNNIERARAQSIDLTINSGSTCGQEDGGLSDWISSTHPDDYGATILSGVAVPESFNCSRGESAGQIWLGVSKGKTTEWPR